MARCAVEWMVISKALLGTADRNPKERKSEKKGDKMGRKKERKKERKLL